MKKEIEVRIPHTPNFIVIGRDVYSIVEFEDSELKEIGRRWTKNLLAKARTKRNSHEN